jgi:phosphopentomutase
VSLSLKGHPWGKFIKRIICLVADGLGVGAAPDAAQYGDDGANTLSHTASAVGGLRLPTLERLGLGNITSVSGTNRTPHPLAWVGRMAEASAGKDTMTGHWELTGIVTRKPFALFPQGFPDELVEAFCREANLPGVLGNRPASGTLIIEQLGEEHLRTLKPILYTSGDSVFQIAAHEQTFGLERLYRICEVARSLTIPFQIGRVIARPFLGEDPSTFRRTERRRDYSIAPGRNCLDVLQENGVVTYSVGKIEDIFDHRALTMKNHTGNNADSLSASLDFLVKSRNEPAFIFTNLFDFDMLYGHRRDAKGFASALSELDLYLPKLLEELGPEDALILTGDHGCDPTFRGTDHTREFVPLILYGPKRGGGNLGDRKSFADVASFLLESFGISRDVLPDLR